MSELEIAKKDLKDVMDVLVDEADDQFDVEAAEIINFYMAAVDKEITRLREALEFYAYPGDDEGKIAIKALQESDHD